MQKHCIFGAFLVVVAAGCHSKHTGSYLVKVVCGGGGQGAVDVTAIYAWLFCEQMDLR